MKNQIIQTALENGISHIGFVKAEIFSGLADRLERAGKTVMMTEDIQKRSNPFLEYEWVKSFIVCLFPYFSGGEKSGISRYAWGKDYHAVVRDKLSPICMYLEEKGYKAEILCDNHNLNDRYLAYKAGLGFFGKNSFLINDDYGTYTFIGSVASSAEIEPDKPLEKNCIGCGMCMRSCPGGAISESGICGEKCVSYITQKKGALTAEETEKIKKSGYIWGCDICQEVCPHNKYAKKTNINAFSQNLLRTVLIDEELSNREFKKKYADRAFAWRGKQTLLRNINILEGENL